MAKCWSKIRQTNKKTTYFFLFEPRVKENRPGKNFGIDLKDIWGNTSLAKIQRIIKTKQRKAEEKPRTTDLFIIFV